MNRDALREKKLKGEAHERKWLLNIVVVGWMLCLMVEANIRISVCVHVCVCMSVKIELNVPAVVVVRVRCFKHARRGYDAQAECPWA